MKTIIQRDIILYQLGGKTTFKKAKLACLKKNNFYFWLLWIFAAACRLSPVAASVGYSLAVANGLLIVVAPLVAECGL